MNGDSSADLSSCNGEVDGMTVSFGKEHSSTDASFNTEPCCSPPTSNGLWNGSVVTSVKDGGRKEANMETEDGTGAKLTKDSDDGVRKSKESADDHDQESKDGKNIKMDVDGDDEGNNDMNNTEDESRKVSSSDCGQNDAGITKRVRQIRPETSGDCMELKGKDGGEKETVSETAAHCREEKDTDAGEKETSSETGAYCEKEEDENGEDKNMTSATGKEHTADPPAMMGNDSVEPTGSECSCAGGARDQTCTERVDSKCSMADEEVISLESDDSHSVAPSEAQSVTPVDSRSVTPGESAAVSHNGSRVSTPTSSRSVTPTQSVIDFRSNTPSLSTPAGSQNHTPCRDATSNKTVPKPATTQSETKPSEEPIVGTSTGDTTNNRKTSMLGSVLSAAPGPTTNTPVKPTGVSGLLPMSRKDEDLRPMADVLVEVGQSLVCQQVYRDLVRVQRKKKAQDRLSKTESDQLSRMEVLYDTALGMNESFHMDDKSCNRCGFRTESANILHLHKEFAHLAKMGQVYLCSFCDFSTRTISAYFSHMENSHRAKGRIHMKMAAYPCPTCPTEHNSRTVFMKHAMKCGNSFNPKRNLEPTPTDCDIPLKKMKHAPAIPPAPGSAYKHKNISLLRSQINKGPRGTVSSMLDKMRKGAVPHQRMPTAPAAPPPRFQRRVAPSPVHPAQSQMLLTSNDLLQPLPLPSGLSISSAGPTQPQYVQLGGQFYCLVSHMGRQMLSPVINPNVSGGSVQAAPGGTTVPATAQPIPPKPAAPASQKTSPLVREPTPPPSSFEVCEICGGFVKDRESLRVHFFWAHKVDIRSDLFHSRKAHLFCDQCGERFWTYQGLSRHQRQKHTAPPQPAAAPLKPVTHTCIVCNQKALTNVLHHLKSVHGISVEMQISMRTCMVCGKALSTEKETDNHLHKSHPAIFTTNTAAITAKTAALATRQPGPNANRVTKRHTTVASMLETERNAKKNPVPTALYSNCSATKIGRMPYCSTCNIQFQSVEQYSAHCRQEHIIACPRCSSHYSSAQHMQKHYYEHHGSEKDICSVCETRVPMGKKFINHMVDQHLKKCSVNLERLSRSDIKMHQQQSLSGSLKDDDPDEVMIVDGASLSIVKRTESPASRSPGSSDGRSCKVVREEVIEVGGEKVIVQQQDEDSDS